MRFPIESGKVALLDPAALPHALENTEVEIVGHNRHGPVKTSTNPDFITKYKLKFHSKEKPFTKEIRGSKNFTLELA